MTISSAFEMAAIEALKGALVSRAPGMLGSPEQIAESFALAFIALSRSLRSASDTDPGGNRPVPKRTECCLCRALLSAGAVPPA